MGRTATTRSNGVRRNIDLWNTSIVLRQRHAIRLEIASSAFPKYDRNLNTGAPLGLTTEFAVAAQTIYHEAAHPSRMVLPIIAGGLDVAQV
jgi:uncharacterized protein